MVTPPSYAAVPFTNLVVTFVSRTQLTVTLPAAKAQTARVYTVLVSTPDAPSVSAAAPITLSSPTPVVIALSKTSTTAGALADTVDVQGTGFYAASQARVGTTTRSVVVVDGTHLRVPLVGTELATPGDLAIAVTNPTPGGGTSAPLALHVAAAVPVITRLPAAGGTVGSGGFDLAVDGANFTTGSVVQWNGADRPTAFRTGTRLTATLGASDVAAAGTARVTVRTPSVATASNATDFVLRSFAAPAVTAQRAIALAANGVIADTGRGLVYASAASNDRTYADMVVAIDPTTAKIVKSVPVGSGPDIMALSDDGQFLYVSLAGSGGVRRVTLASFTADLAWSLGGTYAEDMRVLPGSPHTVVISTKQPGISPGAAGVFVYDDGVARPKSVGGALVNSIGFAGSPTMLYGVNGESTSDDFTSMRIDADGISVAGTVSGLSAFYDRLADGNGRVYGNNGAVLDAEFQTRVGSLPYGLNGAGIGVHVDPRLGRVYVIGGNTLSAYDMNTYRAAGSVSVWGYVFDHPALSRQHLARWSADGFAWRDGSDVYFVQTTLALP